MPKAGLKFFDWTFVQGSTLVILLKFCAKNPRLRQAAKRCALCKMCSAKFNFGNFKFEKNADFGRNFLSRRF
ncbi:hypothetical protein EIB71_00105 [Kaistella daneshvariae]|uniref:Uncharacterized protein n=1 Tax=Kaistella daneshvariae TaxID=2487074 RepID=A0ABM7C5D7_9FLAO|nr:hypothetical protein EIB71_00105 [Kaistella daneshvariae]